MTDCTTNQTTQEYEFTAFTGADLLDVCDNNLGCGDSFFMPTAATTLVTVTDNDGSLSGDSCANEYGNDYSHQTADIVIDGALIHEGTRIYAEEYYILQDQSGNQYVLIEIEVVGAADTDRDDLYSFIGALPPSGVELTVVGRQNVWGNWVDYNSLSAGTLLDFTQGNTFVIDGPVQTEVTITELDGELVFTVRVPDTSSNIGDLRGFFFDVADETLIGDMVLTSGPHVTEARFLKNKVSNLGNGANVNGEIVNTGGRFDAGIEIGTAGMSWDDIQETSFRVALKDGPIDVSALSGARFAVRYTSVGEEGGTRDDSTKSVGFMNSPPEALDDAAATDEDTPISMDLLANDSDIDGDALTVILAGGQAPDAEFGVTSANGRSGLITVTAAGILTFTPTDAFDEMKSTDVDTVALTYVIDDGNGATDTATATITITGVNDAPIAEDDFFTVSETELATLDILANDSDPEGDPLTVTLLSNPIEGSISLNIDGTVAFDPGTDFLALEDGQTATVTFLYQISDGELTDTATVHVTVLGEGVCVPNAVVTTGVGLLTGGQDMTVVLETPDITKDGTADVRFSVNLGDVAQDRYNFVFVVDVSGSTGVDDSFGVGATVLQAEIEALQNLTDDILSLGLTDGSYTISIVPFSTSVQIVDTNPADEDFNFVQTFGDDEVLDSGVVGASLDALSAGGETNYLAAVFAAAGTIQQLELAHGDANNIVHFLSDGNPFPENSQPPFLLEIVAAQLHAQAAVHAIGVGSLVTDTTFLDPLDNTGGAQIVTDTASLDASLREAPFAASTILGATLNVFDSAGVLVDSFDFTGSDFDETPLGYELSVAGVAGLDFFVGEVNTAQLVVDLDGDGDLVADDTVTLNVEIEGLLPLSFDF